MSERIVQEIQIERNTSCTRLEISVVWQYFLKCQTEKNVFDPAPLSFELHHLFSICDRSSQ